MQKVNYPWRRILALSLAGVCGLSGVALAQGSSSGIELETRASLEQEASKAEAQHRTQEAWLLRQRLQKGDFQDGDRIIIKLMGSVTMPIDTFTVRAGKILSLPQMGDFQLEGVLRSELENRLSHHLAGYLRDSTVRAQPLVRLAVLGQVRNPNYFYVPADVLLSDVVMRAGGPAPGADLGNMIIKRSGDVIWNQQDTRTALADGLSLDRLHLRAGDEIYLDDQRTAIDWRTYLQFIGPVVALLGVWRRYF